MTKSFVKKDYPIYGDFFRLFKVIIIALIFGSIAQIIIVFSFFKNNILNGIFPNISILNLISLLSTVITSLVVVYYAKKSGRTYLNIGLNTKKIVPYYLIGLIIGFVALSITLLITFLLGGATFIQFNDFDLFLLVYFIGFIFQGFTEELMCRGYMMDGLKKGCSLFMCIILNSLFFSFLHIFNFGFNILSFVNIFLIGIVLSLLTIIVDNIWISSGMHTMWNFALGNIYGIYVSGLDMGPSLMNITLHGNYLISGGSFGLEGTIACTIVSCILIIFLYFKTKSKINIYIDEN